MKTQMKCSIMLHFIRVCTDCSDENKHAGTEMQCTVRHNSEYFRFYPKITDNYTILIVLICIGKSIRIQEVEYEIHKELFLVYGSQNRSDH